MLAGKDVVVKTAAPPATGPLPIKFTPSKKFTVPVMTAAFTPAAAAAGLVTKAVKVSACPAITGLGVANKLVVVEAGTGKITVRPETADGPKVLPLLLMYRMMKCWPPTVTGDPSGRPLNVPLIEPVA